MLKSSVIVLLFLSFTALCEVTVQYVDAQFKTITVPNDYSTIQAAIDSAVDGDTVSVKNGVYACNITVNKSINLVGEDVYKTVINATSTAIKVSAKNVVITGFTLTSPEYTESYDYKLWNSQNIPFKGECGIYLSKDSSGCTVTKNRIINDKYGIQVISSSDFQVLQNDIFDCDKGVFLSQSNNALLTKNFINGSQNSIFLDQTTDSTISLNSLTNQNDGIDLYGLQGQYYHGPSTGNSIISNNIVNCRGDGIRIDESSNNIASGNNIWNSNSGFSITSSFGNTVESNIVANSTGWDMTLYDANNNSILTNLFTNGQAGGILGVNCSNNNINGNEITNNNDNGMDIMDSQGNTIQANHIENNGYYGLSLSRGGNNTVNGNSILNSRNFGLALNFVSSVRVFNNDVAANPCGVSLQNSTDIAVYHNNLGNNQVQVSIDLLANVWDNGYPSGGNYWSDYHGADPDNDGIGDTPYTINTNNSDRYPLMSRVEIAVPEQVPSLTYPDISSSGLGGLDFFWLFIAIVSGAIIATCLIVGFKVKRKNTLTRTVKP